VSTPRLGRFDAAVKWLRERVPLKDSEYAELEARARRRAFRVAGIAKVGMVQEVLNALALAVERGETLKDFKDRVGQRLEREWKGSVANPPARLEIIFRNNLQTAYNAGRVRELRSPDVAAILPYWQVQAVLDKRTTAVCTRLHGTILPATHSWWSMHVPPYHHGCRTVLIGRTRRQFERSGLEDKAPDLAADPGFGQDPLAYDAWKPDTSKLHPRLRRVYEKLSEPGKQPD
jgi:SPP1 gp7 family putative phage head morphogenesis protein